MEQRFFVSLIPQAGYGVALVGRAMGGGFGISQLREACAFGAGIGRCVAIEVVAHKCSAQEEEWCSGRGPIDDGPVLNIFF